MASGGLNETGRTKSPQRSRVFCAKGLRSLVVITAGQYYEVVGLVEIDQAVLMVDTA